MFAFEALDNRQLLSRLAEPQSRQIFAGVYHNLALSPEDRAMKSVLICAANRQEGATTVALGLALAAAECQAEKVLLIDGNFHGPRVCGAFGLPESTGLGDLILGRVNPGAVVRPTMIANLWVMGAGVAHLGHLKSLEPPSLRDLLQELAQEFALVIMDGPAINAYPEAVLYAAQADRTFLVVHSGVTRVPVIQTALAKLGMEGGSKVEIILNRRTFSIPAWIYKKL